MTVIRFHYLELMAAQANPLPWWSPNPRWKNGRVAPGEPAEEVGEDGETPTGYYLMCHPDIDTWDMYVLDVMRAGWNYTTNHPQGADLIAMQQAQDWEEWDRIEYARETGLLTEATALARIMGYLLTLGRSLGVPDPVDENGTPLVAPDPIILSDLPARP